MARKSIAPTLRQIQDALVAHGFEVKPAPGITDGLWVQKYGCAAVLARGTGSNAAPGIDPGPDAVVTLVERPGALIQGQIARLLDRGYQKFLMTAKFELPATAQQLQSIHKFTEELTLATGGISLYNEALGTTSDLYEYDRVKGREPVEAAPARPWDQPGGAAH
jgi:hypothetical protein